MLARLLLSSSLVLPASSPAPPAAEAPAFTGAGATGARQWLHAVWSDGDGLLAILEYGKIHLSCRTGEEAILAGVSGLQAVDGRWIDGAPVVVAVSDEGTLVRWRAGAWELLAVPRSGRDPLVAVAIDARGRVVVAGATGGIHRLDGERWQSLAYPVAMKAVALSGLADGSFVVLGAEGELARGQPGREQLEQVVVPDLPRAPGAAWLGPGGALWIGGHDELVRVEVARGRVDRRLRHGLFGGVRVLTGAASADGERVFIGAQSNFAAVVGARVERLGLAVTFPEGLALDLRGARLMVVNRDGFTSWPYADLAAASERPRGPAPACPLPPGTRSQRPEDLLRPVPKDSTPATPVAAPTVVAAPPVEAAPVRRRVNDDTRPTIRIGFGGAFAPRSVAMTGASRSVSGFTLDVALGAAVGVGKRAYLWPELGYNFTVREGRSGHFFTAGLTPLLGSRKAMIGLGPRLVVGDAWGAAGVGVRSGLVASFALNILSLELGHQWLRAGHRDLHDGRFMISVDMTGLFALFVIGSIARAVFGRRW